MLRSRPSALVRRFSQPWREAAALNALFAPTRFVDEHVFLTKSGSVGVVFTLAGIDSGCLSDETIEVYTKRLETEWRSLDEDIRIYQYVVKQEDAPLETSDSQRVTYLAHKGLYSIRLFLVLLYEKTTPVVSRATPRKLRVYTHKLAQAAEYLRIKARSFEEAVSDLLHLELCGKAAAFQFFRLLANPDPAAAGAETFEYDNHLDYWMSSGVVACAKDGVHIDRRLLEVLALRKVPKQTRPVLLGKFLAMQANFILCSEYKREPMEKTVDEVNGAQNHFQQVQWLKNLPSLLVMAFNKGKKDDIVPDKSAQDAVEELKETISRIKTRGEHMGRYALILVLHSDNRAKLQAAAAEAIRIVGNQEGSLVRETYNALNSYLAIIPGNTRFNLRQIWLLSQNYADLSLVYAPGLGNRVNPHLRKQEHLLVLETRERTPYYFNLHEDCRLGFLVIGEPGSGKSFTTNLFIHSSQKYQPFTFILDVGNSYKYITQKHGGTYINLRLTDNKFSINPFALEKTPANLQFLFSFVRVLLTNSEPHMTPRQDRELFEAVQGAQRLGDLRLPEDLMDRLYPWIGDHQYGSLFDNAEDTLSIADFQAFDFSGIEVWPQVVEPLLFYIFQRISAVVYNPEHLTRFKQLIADEAWQFLTNPTAKSYLKAAGATWRKHNGGIGLLTQSLVQLEEAGMLEIMNELCPTKILLPNPGADIRKYAEIFKLNPNEALQFAELRPRRQILVKTPSGCHVLEVSVDAESAVLFGNDPFGNDDRNKAIAEYGEEEGLRRLAAV